MEKHCTMVLLQLEELKSQKMEKLLLKYQFQQMENVSILTKARKSILMIGINRNKP